MVVYGGLLVVVEEEVTNLLQTNREHRVEHHPIIILDLMQAQEQVVLVDMEDNHLLDLCRLLMGLVVVVVEVDIILMILLRVEMVVLV